MSVADDAHNQDLSERRAKAVSGRLKTLTDLSAWKEAVSGKGGVVSSGAQ